MTKLPMTPEFLVGNDARWYVTISLEMLPHLKQWRVKLQERESTSRSL